MPRKLGCNGFSLFAEQMKDALEEKFGKPLNSFGEVMHAASPFWENLDDDDRKNWKTRARDYKKSDDFQSKKKASRFRNFDKKQRFHRMEERGGNAPGAAESDLEDADFHEPMELPGPVQKSTKAHRKPHKPGLHSVFDLVDGNLEDVLKVLADVQQLKPPDGEENPQPIQIQSAGWEPRKYRKDLPPRFKKKPPNTASGDSSTTSKSGGRKEVNVVPKPRTPLDSSTDSMEEAWNDGGFFIKDCTCQRLPGVAAASIPPAPKKETSAPEICAPVQEILQMVGLQEMPPQYNQNTPERKRKQKRARKSANQKAGMLKATEDSTNHSASTGGDSGDTEETDETDKSTGSTPPCSVCSEC